jgi:hypothetical protein
MHVVVTLYATSRLRCCVRLSTRGMREPSHIPLRLRPDNFEFAQWRVRTQVVQRWPDRD